MFITYKKNIIWREQWHEQWTKILSGTMLQRQWQLNKDNNEIIIWQGQLYKNNDNDIIWKEFTLI